MTDRASFSVAVIGAGMGGLAAAATLRQIGVDVQVYEQARQFGRVGAGIQMMPNSMKVLRKIGVEAHVRQQHRSRRCISGSAALRALGPADHGMEATFPGQVIDHEHGGGIGARR